ncbi:MAG: MBOAT family O-acyltransferase [Thermoplasmatota archaeon]
MTGPGSVAAALTPLAWLEKAYAQLGCDTQFNTYCFLFLFLPLTLAGYWLVPSRRWKLSWITAMSFLFYSFWDIRFVLLLLVAAGADFLIALRLAAIPEGEVTRRKRWLAASVVFNLGLLAYFKYAVFALDNARSVLSLFGSEAVVPYANIVLPVGISFYTFQTMSYSIDVYRGQVGATRDFTKYLAFVTLFPQLVAGPIVRYSTLSEQLDKLPTRLSAAYGATGLFLVSLGLFKKAVVADLLAIKVDGLWAAPGALDMVTAWTAATGFMLQLYFDFSGYSDMAIGLGALLGLRFPINFRAPFQAPNPIDFWRRWHVSLNTFLRDYLFRPLGGRDVGPLRFRFNLFVVMVLSGFWHGASWTFILWGGYFAMLQLTYVRYQTWWDARHIATQMILMQVLVVVSAVLFRAPDLTVAGQVYQAMFTPALAAGMAGLAAAAPLLLGVLALYAVTMVVKPACDRHYRLSPLEAGAAAVMLVASIIIMRLEFAPFLYYQF